MTTNTIISKAPMMVSKASKGEATIDDILVENATLHNQLELQRVIIKTMSEEMVRMRELRLLCIVLLVLRSCRMVVLCALPDRHLLTTSYLVIV